MGYYTSIMGQITPDRYLSVREQKILHDAFVEQGLDYRVQIIEGDGTIDFDRGDEGNFYDGELRLIAAFDMFAKNLQALRAQELNIDDTDLSPVLFSGELSLEGEENDDMWKIIVDDNVFYTQRPRIAWDDDRVKIS